jgi:hypothetical protein
MKTALHKRNISVKFKIICSGQPAKTRENMFLRAKKKILSCETLRSLSQMKKGFGQYVYWGAYE